LFLRADGHQQIVRALAHPRGHDAARQAVEFGEIEP